MYSDNDAFYSSQQFQCFFKTSPRSLVLKADVPVFTILAVSDKYLHLVHKKRSEILGKGLFEAFPGNEGDPSEKNSVYSSFIRVIQTKTDDELPIFKYEIVADETGKKETHYWTNLNEPLLDEDGNTTYIINTTTNITGQIRQEQAVEESESRFQLMAEGTDVMIGVSDKVGNAIYFNQAWERYTGRSRFDLMESGWIDLIHPDDEERVMKIYTEALQLEQPWNWEFRIPDREGQFRWLLSRGIPRFHLDGSFAGYISSTVDIQELKENEQRKNDFITMVSHELKTPLTSMNSYVQVLQKRASNVGDELAAGMLEKAGKQIGKMTALINGFLNVSRLESAKIHIEQKTFDMADLITETEDEIQSQVSSHTVIFAPAEMALVNADRDKIGQVISNLISNAVKYSPQGSTIHIACVNRKGKALVSVKDEGIGINKNDLPKLFERYYRVKNVETQHIAGFGIGLYLSFEIIKRHKGSIWADSEIGKGSTFYFSLPVTA